MFSRLGEALNSSLESFEAQLNASQQAALAQTRPRPSSELGESALANLRKSLHKGRESLEQAARKSLDSPVTSKAVESVGNYFAINSKSAPVTPAPRTPAVQEEPEELDELEIARITPLPSELNSDDELESRVSLELTADLSNPSPKLESSLPQDPLPENGVEEQPPQIAESTVAPQSPSKSSLPPKLDPTPLEAEISSPHAEPTPPTESSPLKPTPEPIKTSIPTTSASLLSTLAPQLPQESLEILKSFLQNSDALQMTLQEQLSLNSQALSPNPSVDVGGMKLELERAQALAKEEEEKRIKSVSLLKALRQKLVKAEKDRDALTSQLTLVKSAESTISENLKNTRAKYEAQVHELRSSQEQQLAKLRASFDRETSSIRATYERELVTRKSQYDAEIRSVRESHSYEVGTRNSRILELETQLAETKTSLESSNSKLVAVEKAKETLARLEDEHSQAKEELSYSLKDALERVAVLTSKLEEVDRSKSDRERDGEREKRLVSDIEAKFQNKMKALDAKVANMEKERVDIEAQMSKGMAERLREIERLRAELDARESEERVSDRIRKERQDKLDELENAKRLHLERIGNLEKLVGGMREEVAKAKDTEENLNDSLATERKNIAELQASLQHAQAAEEEAKNSCKTLRDELKKIQAGLFASEKQRNPGVGFFSSFSPTSPGNENPPNIQPLGLSKDANVSTSTLSSANAKTEEEAINFEYIRNVILQFLENKEMRPHLVSVLGVILHFTPSEIRRLTAKASA